MSRMVVLFIIAFYLPNDCILTVYNIVWIFEKLSQNPDWLFRPLKIGG